MGRPMSRSRGLAGALFIIVIGLPLIGLALVVLQGGVPHGGAASVYSVADLRAALDRQPAVMLGRPLYVKGVAEGCVIGMAGPGSPCRDPSPMLVDRTAVGADASIDLGWAPPSWLQAHVGSVPLLGLLVDGFDPPQTIHWGTPALYRVEIVAFAALPNALGIDYEALLL